MASDNGRQKSPRGGNGDFEDLVRNPKTGKLQSVKKGPPVGPPESKKAAPSEESAGQSAADVARALRRALGSEN